MGKKKAPNLTKMSPRSKTKDPLLKITKVVLGQARCAYLKTS